MPVGGRLLRQFDGERCIRDLIFVEMKMSGVKSVSKTAV